MRVDVLFSAHKPHPHFWPATAGPRVRRAGAVRRGLSKGFLEILELQKLNPVFCLQAFEVTCNLCVRGRCWEKRKWSADFSRC